jgi:hypothetical protein
MVKKGIQRPHSVANERVVQQKSRADNAQAPQKHLQYGSSPKNLRFKSKPSHQNFLGISFGVKNLLHFQRGSRYEALLRCLVLLSGVVAD